MPPSLPLAKPFDIAVDTAGRKWVTGNGSNSVLMMSADGVPQLSVTAGGIRRPLGIASDSLGNVWVANTGVLPVPCGCDSTADFANAVQNLSPGDHGASVTMIGPDGFDGLVRNTGVQIDPSGDVWLANNWQTVPVQTNPGGHEMVVFVGLATPVRTPLLGAPRQP